MIIKKDPKSIKISKKGIVYDYPLPSEEIGVSLQELDGRVPDEGFYKNNVCKEICYVISGSAEVFINNKKFSVSREDVFVINPKETSYIIAKKLKMLVITSPNWYEQQCEHIK